MIREENPLTLRYLLIALHDINLVHILGVLGYYSDVDDPEHWGNVGGVDLNSSVRFEIYDTIMFTEESVDLQPKAFIKIIFDDVAIACDLET